MGTHLILYSMLIYSLKILMYCCTLMIITEHSILVLDWYALLLYFIRVCTFCDFIPNICISFLWISFYYIHICCTNGFFWTILLKFYLHAYYFVEKWWIWSLDNENEREWLIPEACAKLRSNKSEFDSVLTGCHWHQHQVSCTNKLHLTTVQYFVLLLATVLFRNIAIGILNRKYLSWADW